MLALFDKVQDFLHSKGMTMEDAFFLTLIAIMVVLSLALSVALFWLHSLGLE